MAFLKFGSSLFQVWLQTFCGWSNAIVADQLVEKVRRQDIVNRFAGNIPQKTKLNC